MLHILPQAAPEPQPRAYAEAVARLASIRHALRLVEPFGAGPASDSDDSALAAGWDSTSEARQRCFDRRSAQLVAATAAGVEALLMERQQGREPHVQASQALVDEIRRELQDIAGIVLG